MIRLGQESCDLAFPGIGYFTGAQLPIVCTNPHGKSARKVPGVQQSVVSEEGMVNFLDILYGEQDDLWSGSLTTSVLRSGKSGPPSHALWSWGEELGLLSVTQMKIETSTLAGPYKSGCWATWQGCFLWDSSKGQVPPKRHGKETSPG